MRYSRTLLKQDRDPSAAGNSLTNMIFSRENVYKTCVIYTTYTQSTIGPERQLCGLSDWIIKIQTQVSYFNHSERHLGYTASSHCHGHSMGLPGDICLKTAFTAMLMQTCLEVWCKRGRCSLSFLCRPLVGPGSYGHRVVIQKPRGRCTHNGSLAGALPSPVPLYIETPWLLVVPVNKPPPGPIDPGKGLVQHIPYSLAQSALLGRLAPGVIGSDQICVMNC